MRKFIVARYFYHREKLRAFSFQGPVVRTPFSLNGG